MQCAFKPRGDLSVHWRPRANSAYMAYEAAKEDAREMLAEPVPLVIRNAPTELDEGATLWRRLCVRT